MFHCTIKVLKTGISQLLKSLKNLILEGYDIAYDLVDPLRQIYFAIYRQFAGTTSRSNS
jgi:hypothetical protein